MTGQAPKPQLFASSPLLVQSCILLLAAIILLLSSLPVYADEPIPGVAEEFRLLTKEAVTTPVPRERRIEQAHSAFASTTLSGLSGGHRPSEVKRRSSLIMHRSAGIAVLTVGLLLLMDRRLRKRSGAFTISIGLIWLLLWAYSFFWGDPECWPVGSVGFLESFSLPTAGEWLQHKVLSLIALVLAVSTFTGLAFPRAGQSGYLHHAFAGAVALAGAVLLVHQHVDHLPLGIVTLQHRFMGISALFIAGSSLADKWDPVSWRFIPLLVPSGLMLLGLQLVLYVE